MADTTVSKVTTTPIPAVNPDGATDFRTSTGGKRAVFEYKKQKYEPLEGTKSEQKTKKDVAIKIFDNTYNQDDINFNENDDGSVSYFNLDTYKGGDIIAVTKEGQTTYYRPPTEEEQDAMPYGDLDYVEIPAGEIQYAMYQNDLKKKTTPEEIENTTYYPAGTEKPDLGQWGNSMMNFTLTHYNELLQKADKKEGETLTAEEFLQAGLGVKTKYDDFTEENKDAAAILDIDQDDKISVDELLLFYTTLDTKDGRLGKFTLKELKENSLFSVDEETAKKRLEEFSKYINEKNEFDMDKFQALIDTFKAPEQKVAKPNNKERLKKFKKAPDAK